MAVKIGSLLIRLAVEHGILQEGLARSERDVARTTKAIQRRGQDIADFGKKMSLAVSLPILALAGASISAAKESADALGQVDAALASMGNQAGRTREQLQELAGEQMRNSLYDDDDILRRVTANLLTFGKIAGQEFDRAQQAAIDLSTRMEGDLKGATIQIGKALNDPVKGVSALAKAGIQFSADQKKMIKSLVETGNVAAAQRIILKELEGEFKGSAKAARDADPGAALAQSFANFQEEIGGKLLPLLPPLLDAATKLIDTFGQLPASVQPWVIALGAAAVVLGPVIAGIGALVSAGAGLIATIGGAPIVVSYLGLAFNTLLAALTVLGPPIAAVAAAIAAWLYWDEIVAVVGRVTAAVTTFLEDTLGVDLTSVKAGISAFGEGFGELADTITGYVSGLGTLLSELWAGAFGEGVRGAGAALVEFGADVAGVLGDYLLRLLSGAKEAFATAFEAIGNVLKIVARVLSGDFSGAWQAAVDLAIGLVQGMGRIFAALFPEMTGYIAALYTGAKQWLQDKLGAVFDWVGRKIKEVGQAFYDLYIAVVGNSYVPDMVDEIGVEFNRLQALMVAPANKATAAVTEATRKMAEDVSSLIDRLFPEFAEARKMAEELALLDAAAADPKIGLSDDLRRRARQRVLEERYGGESTVSEGLLGEGPLVDFKAKFDELQEAMRGAADAAKVQTVQIAQSFKDMADQTLSALERMVGAIKGGGFLDILSAAINLFLQVAGTGLFGKKLADRVNAPRVPGNANGTAFHPGGLMMVGERGPEILQVPRGGRVVPNHELRAAGEQSLRIILEERTDIVAGRIDRRIGAAAGPIAEGGAQIAQARLARRQTRRIA